MNNVFIIFSLFRVGHNCFEQCMIINKKKKEKIWQTGQQAKEIDQLTSQPIDWQTEGYEG